MEKKIECKLLKKVRQKKKLTPSELQEITQIAKEELKFLARNNIPLIPENYILWFEIFCYLHENGLELSDLEIMGLFKEKYPTVDNVEAVLLQVEDEDRELLKSVAQEIVTEIEKLIEVIVDHNNTLEEKENSFKEIRNRVADSSVKDLLGQVLEELCVIRQQNEELKNKLEEANQQIKKLTQELEQTKKEASIDFLTQVANRASFDRAITDMVNDFYRRNYPFALLMIDIDNFKKINDTYGHQAGDYVLRELARLLKSQLRARDIIARYGGEEFAILLPGVTFSQAIRVAERLRKSVEKHLFKYNDQVIPVTISVGVAMMRDGLDETALVEKADKALYLAKRSGKNQVKTDLDVELEE
ncbi:diguanylate cyclase [Thermovibrio ammonificans]|uniref:diguanylate cyclase n=1 Tax=Thermovibrio ammonificans (strain DSM 15698 / JCM 12110 / HB-1) TaxID=648996 RepID=E8T5Z5_THEA1|nr:diguanylate cyclase [Thermovibrio ammonificans]ADU96579.1 diguanylate cyclase [Thermovibrio ammonificans HB-1]